MKYELQDLLRVRDHRQEHAEELLQKAKHALTEAEIFLQKQKKKEEDFLKKKPIFIQNIYLLAMQKTQFKRNYLDLIHLKLGKLDEHQMKLAKTVEEAHNRCEEAQKNVQTCMQALMQARKELSKIEEHKKIWQQEMNQLEELNQDKELEDFKTKHTDEN